MILPIPSTYNRFGIELRIGVRFPMDVGIRVRDPRHPNSHYFRRKAHFSSGGQSRTFQVKIPISPEKLVLEIFDKATGGDEGITVSSLKFYPLIQPKVWATPARHRFMQFAMDFAQKAGYAATGFYPSAGREFLIQYLPTIVDAQGEELVTPARIHRKMPRVQLSQKLFQKFTVPVRVAILSHEGCHWFLNTRSEKEADLCGISYYLDYGFPTIEAVYAATKVFSEHPDTISKVHVNRAKDIIEFIDQHQANA